MENPALSKKQNRLNKQFFMAVVSDDREKAEAARKAGADVNAFDPLALMAPLHWAVGSNNLKMTKYLVEECGAVFRSDAFRRWPTVVAIACNVSLKMHDYIVMAEAKGTPPELFPLGKPAV